MDSLFGVSEELLHGGGVYRLYLNVPYQEKEHAKSLGAKWDAKVKKWYINTTTKNFVKFSKWILKDTDDATIAIDYIYIIEGHQNCWKCGQITKVVGLGIGEFVHVYESAYGVQYEIYEDYENPGEELHLAWTANENDIPPKLLRYLKRNYSVKTGYSRTIGDKCFANHCDCCGALQGNWFLFNEPDSPLSSCVEGSELIERMHQLKIIGIPIDAALQLNWDIGFCSNDYAYFKYAHFEELILSSNPEDEYISYEELYM